MLLEDEHNAAASQPDIPGRGLPLKASHPQLCAGYEAQECSSPGALSTSEAYSFCLNVRSDLFTLLWVTMEF